MTKILLIDDDKIVCHALKAFLEKNSFKVIVLNDGERVLHTLNDEQPNLIITDLVMPNVEGIELISQIREKDEGIPIIAISGGGKVLDKTFLNVAETIGANATLVKPFQSSVLLQTINSLI